MSFSSVILSTWIFSKIFTLDTIFLVGSDISSGSGAESGIGILSR